MLPMRLFRNRAFFGINVASLLMFLGMFGSIFLLSQFLQGVARLLAHRGRTADAALDRHADDRRARSPGILSDRIGGRPVVAAGLALQAVGLGLVRRGPEPDVSYAAQLPALILSGIGMALYFAPAANVVMSSVRPAEQGIASGANNALREVGGALGVAVLAAVFSAQGGYEIPAGLHRRHRPRLWIGAGGAWPSPRRSRPADPRGRRAPDGARRPGRRRRRSSDAEVAGRPAAGA